MGWKDGGEVFGGDDEVLGLGKVPYENFGDELLIEKVLEELGKVFFNIKNPEQYIRRVKQSRLNQADVKKCQPNFL